MAETPKEDPGQGMPDVIEIDMGELLASAEKSELGRLSRKVSENLELVVAIVREKDYRKRQRLVKELEKRLGIPVFLVKNRKRVYPALVVETTENSWCAAWLELEDARLGFPWEYVELELSRARGEAWWPASRS